MTDVREIQRQVCVLFLTGSSSTVVKHSTHDSKFAGSNPATAGTWIEILAKNRPTSIRISSWLTLVAQW
jgi:hypothetical protein